MAISIATSAYNTNSGANVSVGPLTVSAGDVVFFFGTNAGGFNGASDGTNAFTNLYDNVVSGLHHTAGYLLAPVLGSVTFQYNTVGACFAEFVVVSGASQASQGSNSVYNDHAGSMTTVSDDITLQYANSMVLEGEYESTSSGTQAFTQDNSQTVVDAYNGAGVGNGNYTTAYNQYASTGLKTLGYSLVFNSNPTTNILIEVIDANDVAPLNATIMEY